MTMDSNLAPPRLVDFPICILGSGFLFSTRNPPSSQLSTAKEKCTFLTWLCMRARGKALVRVFNWSYSTHRCSCCRCCTMETRGLFTLLYNLAIQLVQEPCAFSLYFCCININPLSRCHTYTHTYTHRDELYYLDWRWHTHARGHTRWRTPEPTTDFFFLSNFFLTSFFPSFILNNIQGQENHCQGTWPLHLIFPPFFSLFIKFNYSDLHTFTCEFHKNNTFP